MDYPRTSYCRDVFRLSDHLVIVQRCNILLPIIILPSIFFPASQKQRGQDKMLEAELIARIAAAQAACVAGKAAVYFRDGGWGPMGVTSIFKVSCGTQMPTVCWRQSGEIEGADQDAGLIWRQSLNLSRNIFALP
jgi:hypothetical protein